MKKYLYKSFILVTLLILSSCIKDDEPNFQFVPLRIQSADLPDSFQLNQTYQIDVTYSVPNGCTDFYRFDVTSSDSSTRNRNVVVFGTMRIDEELSCTQAIQEQKSTFNFRVDYTETYVFRFWQSEDADGNQQYLEIEVPVM